MLLWHSSRQVGEAQGHRCALAARHATLGARCAVLGVLSSRGFAGRWQRAAPKNNINVSLLIQAYITTDAAV